MDFERAAQRLANDQKTSRLAARQKTVGLAVSARAKREAEERRRKTAAKREAEERRRKKLLFAVRYMERCDERLGVTRLNNRGEGGDAAANEPSRRYAQGSAAAAAPTWSPNPSLQLRPVSIHGDGDKLSLPPSVLASMAESGLVGGTSEGGQQQPLLFRIGILNKSYVFPSSPAVKEIMESAPLDYLDNSRDAEMDSDGSEMSDSEYVEKQSKQKNRYGDTAPYLEELTHKYHTHTHATVVEFTMEEGSVGLPKAIASALLENNSSTNAIPRTRTRDPAAGASSEDNDMTTEAEANSNDDKTAGHLAWSAFDVPDTDVEITLVKLPKGEKCTLSPTEIAVRNGFYNLKDVKLVLEQSLIRTRATLSVNDVVHTWHRGTKFDLIVKYLKPDSFGAVSCINTDIEVDFASFENNEDENTVNDETEKTENKRNPGMPSAAADKGYTLSDGVSTTAEPVRSESPMDSSREINLPPEPEDGQEGVCTVQIRGDGVTGRRRFVVAETSVKDLFAFASVSCNLDVDASTYRLVTRFPRRIFSINDADKSLQEAGIMSGQEMFMVERL